MRLNQKHPPKYWVVNDKHDSDVLLYAARKCKGESIQAYVDYLHKELPHWNKEDLDALYYDNLRLECILVEIRIVEEG